VGLRARQITIALALKPMGYATGQFGKTTSGSATTVHRFDSLGNLFHLNVEEEPERPQPNIHGTLLRICSNVTLG
jgi:arylsulfatase A-like enzyme